MEEVALMGLGYLQQLADGGAVWAVWVSFGLGMLGALSVLASVVIAATPSKKDDEWLAKAKDGSWGWLFKLLDSLSLIHKK